MQGDLNALTPMDTITVAPYNHTGFNLRDKSILWKELVPIVLVCKIWANTGKVYQ